MQRIILVGFAGSGKNTVAEYLISQHGYYGISFADCLKDVVASIFCWPRHLLEGDTPESRIWREALDPWWSEKLGIVNFTPRYAMRHIGTEVLREQFNDAIWRLNVERRMEQAGEKPVVVIDGRFRQEIKMVTEQGGTAVRVRRGEEPSYWSLAEKAHSGDKDARGLLGIYGIHPSEWDWIGHKFDVTIENNGTLEQLHAAVDDLVRGQRDDDA